MRRSSGISRSTLAHRACHRAFRAFRAFRALRGRLACLDLQARADVAARGASGVRTLRSAAVRAKCRVRSLDRLVRTTTTGTTGGAAEWRNHSCLLDYLAALPRRRTEHRSGVGGRDSLEKAAHLSRFTRVASVGQPDETLSLCTQLGNNLVHAAPRVDRAEYLLPHGNRL